MKQLKHNKFARKTKRHGGDHSSWAVSYVDMLTLLLCFFIIFFSFDKTPKVKKELSVLDKISSYFDPNANKGTTGVGYGPGNGGGAGLGEGKGTGSGTGVHSGKAEGKVDGHFVAKGEGQGGNGGESPTPAPDKAKGKGWSTIGQMVKDRQHLEEGQHAVPKGFAELSKIEKELKDQKLQMSFKQKAIVVEFPHVSFFDSGSTKLNQSGGTTVDFLIKVLDPFKEKIKIKVQGHTDPRPLTVKKVNYSDNWELSVLRATSVLKVFLQHNFTPDQLTAEGFADTQRGIASENENHANLRRITLLIEEK